MTTPATDPREFLDEHLRNDLKYLLCAATEWFVQESIPEADKPTKNGGHFVQVYAMDSATLHARAFLEFFTRPTRPEPRNHLGVDFYEVTLIDSPRYGTRNSDPALGCWCDPMNRYLMHLNERPGGQQLLTFDDDTERKHLKLMPVDFAREVVRLWRLFITQLDEQPNELASLARDLLADAIGNSTAVVGSEINARYGIDPIEW